MTSPDVLPEGWVTTTLGDGLVRDIQPGFACGAHSRDAGGIPHLRPMNVDREGRISLADVKYVPLDVVTAEEQLLRQGDVLFNNTNSPALVGKTAYYDLPDPRAFSNHMTRLRCAEGVLDPLYCALALHHRWQEGYFERVCNNHVSQASVSRAVLLQTEIALPPLPEQHRIVAAVEALLARVNAARNRLATVPAILKRFHQAVLAAACSGRLTEDWRATNLSVEPVTSGATQASGRYPSRREKGGSQSDPPELEKAELPEVPSTWRWLRLPDVGEFARGKSRHRPRNDPSLYGGHYPFIQTGDIARCGGRITSHHQTYSERGLAQSRLWPAGTVCITIAANIADSALLTYPACFPDSVVGLVADPGRCLPAYAEFFLRTARDDLSQFAPATAQKNINLEILNEVAIPLPPIPEQQEIVRRVESLFSLADTVEKRVAVATARAEKTPQATLRKAFSGQLVPTEAELARAEGRNYEAAETLLDRVRREHQVQPNSRVSARGGGKQRLRTATPPSSAGPPSSRSRSRR